MINRRRTLSVLLAKAPLAFWTLLGASARSFAVQTSNKGAWPSWETFLKHFVSDKGRVIDQGSPRSQTYSEGQSYALFFALVANDRINFDKILRWTEDNLCQGDMTAHLPAWLWGHRDDDTWGVLDGNSASDSDLWIAYALGEAGRLWDDRRYRLLSNLLIARILREETAVLPGLGLCLLPGPKGFEVQPGQWRLNPSYMPMCLMTWLAQTQASSQWKELADTSLKVIIRSAPKGFVPDWILYDAERGFLPDLNGAEKGQGGYNAIRVYLWAGAMSIDSADRPLLLKTLMPMAAYIQKNGYPPESIDILSGQATRPGSAGFSAAMLPFLQAISDKKSLQQQLDRIEVRAPAPDRYYEQVLSLFGRGSLDGLYRFDKNGFVHTQWKLQ